MARKLLIFLIVVAASGSLWSQREFNNWYFGKYCGVSFNGILPEKLTDGKMLALEGCSSVSDRYGNLLFYTNGVEVFNKKHEIMKNGDGLMGNTSSSQSALIVPRPGNNYEYYIFTIDKHGEPNGMRYSIVDMERQNGDGEITQKNVLVYTPTTEKITAVRHANEIDLWIITHEWRGNAFKVYLLTHEGIKDSVISRVGVYQEGDSLDNTLGYMKASPHGNRLAIAYDSLIQVLDFNNANGRVSNPVTLNKGHNYISYGLEFSPDGTKLFAVNFKWLNKVSTLSQFNLLAGNQTAVQNSEIVIHEKQDYTFGAIQRGPNNKIYVAKFLSETLGVINNPNEVGFNCDYRHEGFDLSPGICQYGLPAFVQTTKNKIIMDVNTPVCRGDSIFLKVESIDGVSFSWRGPDGFKSNEQNPVIPKSLPEMTGTYHVVITYKDGFIDSSKIDLVVLDTRFTELDIAEFEPLAIGGVDSKDIRYKNNSVFDIQIDSIYLLGLAGNTFRLSGLPVMPYTMAAGSEYQVNLKFYPVEVMDFYDSIVVEISSPCPIRYVIPVHSRGLTKDLHIWLVDTIGDVGQKDFCIPVTAALVSEDSVSYKSSYKITIKFDALAYLPYPNQPGITHIEKDSMRTLIIEGGPVLFNYKTQKLTDICGTLYWGKEDTTPLVITDFEWQDTLTTIYKHDGSLRVNDFCNYDISRITAYKKPVLSMTYNTAGGRAKITTESSMPGSHWLSVYTASGELIFERDWICNGILKTNEFDIDFSLLGSGLYLAVLRAPEQTVTAKAAVVK